MGRMRWSVKYDSLSSFGHKVGVNNHLGTFITIDHIMKMQTHIHLNNLYCIRTDNLLTQIRSVDSQHIKTRWLQKLKRGFR